MEHCSDTVGPKGRNIMCCRSSSKISQIILVSIFISSVFSPIFSAQDESDNVSEVKEVSFDIISIIPHDTNAFTQGLEIYDGKFYESTGLYSESSVRIVNMITGEVELQWNLSEEHFGEGLTIHCYQKNESNFNASKSTCEIYQLTWKEQIGFIYNLSTLEPLKNFTYAGEGWGLCSSKSSNMAGSNQGFWISDGSTYLQYFDTSNFSNSSQILEIIAFGNPIDRWNELECLDGPYVLANRWYDDSLYHINTNSGNVCQKVDFSELRTEFELESSGVLNGIALSPRNENIIPENQSQTYWITGKNWSNYYEVSIDFENLDENCQIILEVDSQNQSFFNSKIGYFSILFLLLLVFVSTSKKRQTQKPPRLGNDEE